MDWVYNEVNKMEQHPVIYDLKMKSSDFYYQNTRYGDVDLEDFTCKKYIGAPYVADEAKSKFNETYCKGVMSQQSPLDTDIRECYNYALCANKDAAQRLENRASSQNSSAENRMDSEAFYRIQLLQTLNLGVGMFLAISGIVLVNIYAE